MLRIRPLLSTLILSATLVLRCAFAQSTLTQIEDTVYTTGGAPFNGTVVVTWTGMTNPAGNSPTPFNTAVKIYNGVLSVLLVPSTTATPAAPYRAVYSSSDGLVSFSETWQVPPSAAPLTLSAIRVATSGDGSTGSGGGSTGAGSTGPIAISQVTGLSSDLNAINGSLTSVTATLNGTATTVTSLSSTVAMLTALLQGLTPGTLSTSFVDGETPLGSIDGSNSSFTLSGTPSPSTLSVFLNGIMLTNGSDYTLAGTTIAFINNRVPQPGDVLQTYYRTSGVSSAPLFVDNETPQGVIDGTNTTFTLSATPLPILSLHLYKNGALLQQNNDYTLNGSTITFSNAVSTPAPGDFISAFYRTTYPSAN